MGLGPRLDIRQSQSLVMTPQLTQAIRLLQLSNLELESVVAEEMAKNPLLESSSDEGEGEGQPDGGPDAQSADFEAQDSDRLEAPEGPGADELISSLGGGEDQPLDVDWQSQALETDSYADLGAGGGGEPGEAFDFERLEACESSLCEHLLLQLHGSSGPEAELAEWIVLDLDEAGYLSRPLSEIAEEASSSRDEAERALRLVQDLDPPGVGARSLSECLALQAKAADRYDPAMARLIENLDLLARGRMQDLKRICGVDDEDLGDMIRELRSYDPKPGTRFSAEGAEAITPDVFVRRTRDGFAVELNGATLPRLLVNRRYYQELRSGPNDKHSRAWLSECLASANWLIRALDQRARTIVKVVSEITKRQQGFFDHGVGSLRPLTLREVAEAIGMHESTVSRVTSNKYMLCDRGLYELKYFFGSGVAASGGDGQGAAAEAVKDGIAALIAQETEVLSDEQIASLLKERGFEVARRTVVKYREAMGIGSSVQRRRQRKITGVG